MVPGVELKLVEHPDGKGLEQYVLHRSVARRQKEPAMLRKQWERLLGKLERMAEVCASERGRTWLPSSDGSGGG